MLTKHLIVGFIFGSYLTLLPTCDTRKSTYFQVVSSLVPTRSKMLTPFSSVGCITLPHYSAKACKSGMHPEILCSNQCRSSSLVLLMVQQWHTLMGWLDTM